MSTLSNATGNALSTLMDDIEKYIDSKLDNQNQKTSELTIEVQNLRN